MLQIALADYRLLKLARIFSKSRFVPKLYALNSITNPGFYYKFLSDIKLRNAVFKTTTPSRFKDMEGILVKYFRPGRRYCIHDIAVSNGISSVELHDLLKKNNIDFELNISDKFSRGYFRGRFLQTVYDATMTPLNYYFCGIYLRHGDAGNLLCRKLHAFMCRHEKSAVKKPVKEFSFYHPETLMLLLKQGLRVLEYDIFETGITEKFDFVRAMNILNRVYFPDDAIVKALRLIKNSVKNEGVFLVGRSGPDGVNRAGFFKKCDNKFIVMEDYNTGSEIKDLVLNID
jgi:hypothetical protein